MKVTKLAFVLMILLFIGCQSKPKKEIVKTSPETIGLNFINDYMRNIENLDFVEWIEKYPRTTKSFKLEIKRLVDEAEKEAPGYGLGFDPILDAQDYPDKGFNLKSIDTVAGYMSVIGRDWESFVVTIKLTRENSKWMIDGCGMVNIPMEKQASRD